MKVWSLSFGDQSRRKSFIRVEFVREGRRSNFDAHCLTMRSVNLSLGRHIWFVAPMEFVLHIFFFERIVLRILLNKEGQLFL